MFTVHDFANGATNSTSQSVSSPYPAYSCRRVGGVGNVGTGEGLSRRKIEATGDAM